MSVPPEENTQAVHMDTEDRPKRKRDNDEAVTEKVKGHGDRVTYKDTPTATPEIVSQPIRKAWPQTAAAADNKAAKEKEKGERSRVPVPKTNNARKYTPAGQTNSRTQNLHRDGLRRFGQGQKH